MKNEFDTIKKILQVILCEDETAQNPYHEDFQPYYASIMNCLYYKFGVKH
jgi:hypothetical protein